MSFLQPALQSGQSTVPDAGALLEGIATHIATKELEFERHLLRALSHTLDDNQELEDEFIDIII